MKNRKLCAVLAAVLCMALALTACGGDPGTTNPGNNPGTGSQTNPGGSQGGGSDGYVFRTSESNPVVTENGTFTKDSVSGPILLMMGIPAPPDRRDSGHRLHHGHGGSPGQHPRHAHCRQRGHALHRL